MDLLDRIRTLLAGRYDVEREIGRGGMSVVYLARDLKHDRDVAVKVLRPELTESVGAERFAREIRVTSRLEHIHILQLYDSGSVDGVAFYVMPYVEGGSLRDRLRKEGALGLDEAIGITEEIADGLSHAHDQGVVHRDIKPENMLFLGEHAVIADFGIAYAYRQAGEAETLTEYGVAIGTPAYMSPEQAAGAPTIDHRSDVYALACVVYEMLCGSPPFEGPTTQAVLARHMQERVPSLSVLRPDLPDGMVRAVERALAKVPGDRFASIAAFADALRDGRQTEPKRSPGWIAVTTNAVRAHPAISTVLAVVLVALYPLMQLVSRTTSPSWEGRPRSVVVLPFRTMTSTDRDRELAVQLADLLTGELLSWDSIGVVPQVALTGPMYDLGITGPTLDVTDDGVKLARRLGVQALLAVSLRTRGDSVFATLDRYDARTGKRVGRPFQASGATTEPMQVTWALARDVLGLGSIPLDPGRRGSANVDALLAENAGTESLAQWRLAQAEQRFRQAIGLDSTYAKALHDLAQTLYWEGRNEEVTQWSTRAVRHAAGIAERDSLHIHALYAFLVDGRYEDARRMYHELIAEDSTDVYAWVMLGAVEFEDPSLTTLADGTLIPRSNLNVAIRAFTKAVELGRGFDLGYGHLGSIYREVFDAAHGLGCPGFELPRQETQLPWEGGETPQQLAAFCPAVLGDSIAWVDATTFDGLAPLEIVPGAERLMQRWMRLVHRWADYAPNEPKPLEELARGVLDQRRHLGIVAPEMIDSVSRSAFEYATRALALRPDTQPGDLLRIANLQLALGDVDSALALTELAIERSDGGPVPDEAANPYLATGRVSRALTLASERTNTTYVPDPETGKRISYGGADRPRVRVQVLAAAGVGGEPLERELESIDRTWSAPSYSARERALLRKDLQSRIRIAMLVDQGALVEWSKDLDSQDPLWTALIESERNPSGAADALARALEAPSDGVPLVERRMLLGMVAARVGNYPLAASLYSTLDSIPLPVERFSSAWGLRTLSYLRRNEVYAAAGDWELAQEFGDRFLAMWRPGDPLTTHLQEQLREP